MTSTRSSKKKFAALAVLPFAAALTLSACGDEEATETAFTTSQNGAEMTLTYTAVGDEVIKQTASNVLDYEAAGLGDKEQAQALLEPHIVEPGEIEGYEQVVEFGETAATEEITIDYEVIDMADLNGLPGFEGSGDLGEADYISLEESRDLLLQAGYTEVE